MQSAPKTMSLAKKPRTKPVQRRTSEMVANAIKSLNEPNGSSLRTIKKYSYIAANYAVDTEQLSPFIKDYLKTAVAAGELVQTTGMGASGSFREGSCNGTSSWASGPFTCLEAEEIKST